MVGLQMPVCIGMFLYRCFECVGMFPDGCMRWRVSRWLMCGHVFLWLYVLACVSICLYVLAWSLMAVFVGVFPGGCVLACFPMAVCVVEALSRHSTYFASSSSSPAKRSMSSAKRRLVIVLPPSGDR